MPGYMHDHTEGGFEPGCSGCELDEVSMRATRDYLAINPLPQQQDRRRSA